MTQYIQGPDGKMRGSIGDGKTNIPTADPIVSTVEETVVNPDYSGLYSQFTVLAASPADEYVPPQLYDIIPQEIYEEDLAGGFIRVQTHPTLPYLIHNYTETATWENHWTLATLTCRGLVTHAETSEVIARPWKKFYNHDQEQAVLFGIDDDVVVTDKVDGSMGILYPLSDGTMGVSTRGSFASEQAVWASDLYARTYEGKFNPDPRYTYLFEIIAPWNRIVVDYNDMEDLVLLGAVDNVTGRSLSVEEASKGWPGPVVEVFPHRTLREVLESPARENAEGFVLWNPETDDRTKYKFDDYKRLHRFMTGCTPKHVWEIMSAGQDPHDVFIDTPDEFHNWLKDSIADLKGQHDSIKNTAEQEYATVRSQLDAQYGANGWTRKDFALHVSKNSERQYLFLLLEERDIDSVIWTKIKPVGEKTIRQVYDASPRANAGADE